MAGVHLPSIADLMGHRHLKTSQIYAKAEVERFRAALGPLLPEVKHVAPVCVTRSLLAPKHPLTLLSN
jgi:hypothetical protein